MTNPQKIEGGTTTPIQEYDKDFQVVDKVGKDCYKNSNLKVEVITYDLATPRPTTPIQETWPKDETRLVKIYRILEAHVKRLEDVRWGSMAFTAELSETRHQLNKMFEEELTYLLQRKERETIKRVMEVIGEDEEKEGDYDLDNSIESRNELRKELRDNINKLEKRI